MSSQYDKLGEMLKIALESGAIPRGQTERHSTEYAASTPAEEVPPVFYMQNEENTSGVKSADTEQQFISSNAEVIRAYAALQLENGAPPAQSKDAYRRLLKKYRLKYQRIRSILQVILVTLKRKWQIIRQTNFS